MLRDHLAAALAGQGSLVLIGGEAGIGKTTLAEAVCRQAAEQGALVLVGHCYDLTETPPYGPWVDLFAHAQSEDGAALPDAFARRGTIGDVASQAALFQQVQDFLTRLASQRPVVLLLDDLHWADPASLGLLRVLARNLASLPLLILVSYRSDDLTRGHPLSALIPLLVRESGAARLDLSPFTAAALHDLVGARYALPAADADRLVGYLLARAEGNPLFTLELLRTLEDDGTLRQDDGWRLGAIEHVQIPPLLTQVIESRVARLDGDALRLLRVAAVIGQEVPLAIWAEASETDDETLLAVVEAAEDARVLGESPHGESVRFTHALLREALYDGIASVRRRRLHRRVGEALAAERNPDPDAVAYQFQRAADPRAVEWLVRAGQRAARGSAWETAEERFATALALSDAWGGDMVSQLWPRYALWRARYILRDPRALGHLEDILRVATDAGERGLRAFALYQLGATYLTRGETERGLAVLTTGVEEIELLPSAERIRSRQWLGMVSEPRATLVLNLANTGRYAAARENGDKLTARVSQMDSGEGRAEPLGNRLNGYSGLGIICSMQGQPSEAREAFARAVAGAVADKAYYGIGWYACDALMLMQLPYETADIAERRQLVETAEAAWENVRRLGGPDIPYEPRVAQLPLLVLEGDWTEADMVARAESTVGGIAARSRVMSILGPLARDRGNPELAAALVGEMLPAGPATMPGTGVFHFAIVIQRLATALALDAADLGSAREWLEAHDRWLGWSGAVLGQSEGQALWSRYYRQAGDATKAHTHADRALAHATAPRQPLALLAAHRLLGELATDAGRFADAVTHLDASLLLADGCAAPYERALTLLARMELLAATGDAAGATMLLDAVRTICTPLGAQPTLARADALAARLAWLPSSPPSYPAGLSAREVEVLGLLVQGMSNRAIAARLFVSARTVERHVTNLYGKIGAHNRADATAFAFRHDLT